MALTVPHIEELLLPGAEALGYEIVAVELSGMNKYRIGDMVCIDTINIIDMRCELQ